jgi:hypothetical protein
MKFELHHDATVAFALKFRRMGHLLMTSHCSAEVATIVYQPDSSTQCSHACQATVRQAAASRGAAPPGTGLLFKVASPII